ncbi:hypothetical protein EQ832_25825 [Pseudomonas sp. ALS1131]|nr:hypothetical protein EQ832_25825 [Pseudomonas sp. ALS1131]
MSGIESSNQGPGWHDHDTPYGTIHSYDGDNHSSYGGHSGGNSHEGISDKTHINISSNLLMRGAVAHAGIRRLSCHQHDCIARHAGEPACVSN